MSLLSMEIFTENFTTEILEKNIVPLFIMFLASFIATFIMLELLSDQKFEGVEYDEELEEELEEDEEHEECEEMEEDKEMEENLPASSEDFAHEEEEEDEEETEDNEEDEEYEEDEEETEDEEDERIPFACRARVNDRIVRHGIFDTTTHTFEFDNGLHAHSPSGACQVILKRRRATNEWQGPSHVYLFINNKWVVFRETAFY